MNLAALIVLVKRRNAPISSISRYLLVMRMISSSRIDPIDVSNPNVRFRTRLRTLPPPMDPERRFDAVRSEGK